MLPIVCICKGIIVLFLGAMMVVILF